MKEKNNQRTKSREFKKITDGTEKDLSFDCPICDKRFEKKDKARTHLSIKHFKADLIQRNQEPPKKPDFPHAIASDGGHVCRICHYHTNHTGHFVSHLGKMNRGLMKGLLYESMFKKFFQGQFSPQRGEDYC